MGIKCPRVELAVLRGSLCENGGWRSAVDRLVYGLVVQTWVGVIVRLVVLIQRHALASLYAELSGRQPIFEFEVSSKNRG